MDEHGYPFVMMVKGMSKLVSSMIDERRGSFECDRDCFVREYSAYGTTLERPLYAGDKKTRCFHLFFAARPPPRGPRSSAGSTGSQTPQRAEGKRHEMSAAESRYFEGVTPRTAPCCSPGSAAGLEARARAVRLLPIVTSAR